MADGGAAVVVRDDELDAARLASEAEALLEDPGRLAHMKAAASALSRPDAALRIPGEVLNVARQHKPG
jgi:UDP-N-acetylglucosamine:LPS N-acetylglucosamine transferase